MQKSHLVSPAPEPQEGRYLGKYFSKAKLSLCRYQREETTVKQKLAECSELLSTSLEEGYPF